MAFCHLHVHTLFSALDGAIKIKDLAKRVKKLGMPAVAITDHGTMAGVVPFYKECKKHAIKPIIGCEFYVAPKSRFDRKMRKAHHLVLLAKNNIGLKNLYYLSSMSYVEGFYYKARIDKDLLSKHSEGLIALSGCLGGSTNSKILNRGVDAAVDHAKHLVSLFEPDSFYLEIQSNEYDRQTVCNLGLMEIAERLDLPLVATSDCHVIKKSDYEAHEILMSINFKKTLDEFRDGRKHSKELYLRTPDDIKKAFKWAPQSALDNTLKIAEQCNVELDLGNVYMPKCGIPRGYIDEESYFEHLAEKGLQTRINSLSYEIDENVYWKQLKYELKVIIEKNYADYFIVTYDFVKFARDNGIAVGPGRGSGAGCIVAWALRITNLDPIKHQLVFERFLNPERKSSPDFDIDFDPIRRDEVIQYVKDKYGENNVSQISTFSSLSGKSAIKDVGRTLGVPYFKLNEITSNTPSLVKGKPPKVKYIYDFAVKNNLISSDDDLMQKVFNVSEKLQGLQRQSGTHACGVLIGQKPIWEYVPVRIDENKNLVAQPEKDSCEESGLVKFDFLGLKTLTVISDAVKMVMKKIPEFDIEKIPDNDQNAYKLIADGNTEGVFQLESDGMKKLLARLQPDRFEDLSAVIALYRPGPLDAGMTESFVLRKNGQEKIDYPHPSCESILNNTYGVIVYQEQVMQIACNLCGFTLGRADVLRKAMGKKIPEIMAELRDEFINGAHSHSGMPKEEGTELFDSIEKFAGYAFNKAHTAAYAWIGYQTAYLKTYYPVEFMAALLSDKIDSKQEVISKYIYNCKDINIPILPPCINDSDYSFTPKGSDGIAFGLGGIKGIGESLISSIIANRKKSKYASMHDFCGRVKVGQSATEQLIRCGAMDCFGVRRSQLLQLCKNAVTQGKKKRKDVEVGQLNIFDASAIKIQYPDVKELKQSTMLQYEKDLLGFYVSGHPMEKYTHMISHLTNTKIGTITPGRGLKLVAMATNVDIHQYKSGKGSLASFTIEDHCRDCNAVMFDRALKKYKDILYSNEPLLVTGTAKRELNYSKEEVIKFYVDKVELLEDSLFTGMDTFRITISEGAQTLDTKGLSAILKRFPGNVPVEFCIKNGGRVVLINSEYSVLPSIELFNAVGDLLR